MTTKMMTLTLRAAASGDNARSLHLSDQPNVNSFILLYLCSAWLLTRSPIASKRASPVTVSYSSDEDSGFEYGNKRKAKSKSKRRKAIDFSEPAEVRFSTRRAAKVANYNEDDDDFEEEDEEDSHGGYVYQQEEEVPVVGIDVVLDYRPKEGAGTFLLHGESRECY
jgi:hypothetical protein